MSDELKKDLEGILQVVNYVGDEWKNKKMISKNAYMSETLKICETLYSNLKKDYKFLESKNSHKELEDYFMSPSGVALFDTMYETVNIMGADDGIGAYFSIIDSRMGILLNEKLSVNERLELDYIKVNKIDNYEKVSIYFCFPKEMTDKINEEFDKVVSKNKDNESMFI